MEPHSRTFHILFLQMLFVKCEMINDSKLVIPGSESVSTNASFSPIVLILARHASRISP